MGRPAHEPNELLCRQVEAMAAYGIPEKDIATVIGIDAKTLRKHYRRELDTGSIKANSRIAESLYRKALGDGAQSVTAAIFWLKTRAQWKETQVNEVTVGGSDSVRLLMQRIAETGQRIQDHDRPRLDLEAVPSASGGQSLVPAAPAIAASPARVS